MWDSAKSFLAFFLFILFVSHVSAVGSHSYYGGQQMDFSAQEVANYTDIVSEWAYSESIDMEERWNGDLEWGNDHHVFAIRLNTKELIREGKLRKDCADIRIAWREQVVASRVEAGTCNTKDTWVYFSNSITESGDGYRFDPSDKVKEIELFYGNANPGVQSYTVSPSNSNPASALHPEGAIETYFGTHCGNTYTSHNTHLHNNDKGAPSQTWHASFGHCHYGDPGTNTIHISDDDGNGGHYSSGDQYTIDSSNAPSWLQEGDTVTVHFHSNSAGDGSSATSGSKSAQYGYANSPPNQPWNPRPSDGSTIYTNSPTLKVDVSDPDGDKMDVTFYTTSSTAIMSDSYPDFSGWSNNPTYTCGSTEMMGGYGNFGSGSSTQKTLNSLSAGTYRVSFDYYHVDSWDGESGRFYWDGVLEWSRSHSHGSDVNDVCGAGWPESEGISYGTVTVEVNHGGGDATLRFTSTLDQGSTDESWGVNNIKVSRVSGTSSVSTSKAVEPKILGVDTAESRDVITGAATESVSASESSPGSGEEKTSGDVYTSESGSHSHSGTAYYGSFTPKSEESRPLNYSRLVTEWLYSESIDMRERWNGDLEWGKNHHVFAIRLDTKELIREGQLRRDCADLRIAWREQVVASRVEAGTCNTEDTWVYFSNSLTESGSGYRFDPGQKVEEVELFYGNPSPGSSGLGVSPANKGPATFLHPEGAIETYFGTHCGNTYVNHNTHLHSNDKSAPSQTWHVDFYHCHSGGVGTRYIHISDDDGNGGHYSSGDQYTIDSSNAPSWLDGGDTVSVHFHSDGAGADSTTSTSSTKSAEWGTAISGNTIDTDYNVGSGSTAKVSWSGLECGKTYNWFAVADDGQEKTQSPTWSFTVYCNGPPKIISGPNFADHSSSRHSFSTSAIVYDRDGDDDISSCDLNVDDGDGNSNSSTMTLDRAYGNGSEAQCIYEYVNYADQSGWGHVENMNAQVTAIDSNGASDSASGSYSFPNSNPSVNSNMDFFDYTSKHAFNISTIVFDGDDLSGELDSCELELDDRDGNVYTENGVLDTSYGATDQAICNFSAVDTSYSGFEVNEQIDVTVTGYDIHGASHSATATHAVPNQLPSITLVNPPDNSDQQNDIVDLKVRASNSDDSSMDVYFFDGNDNRLGFETVTSGGTADAQWDDVVSGGDYEWYVKVDDSHENATSPTWSFTKVTSKSFRVDSELQYEYSTVITSVGRPAYVDFTVRNVVSETKNLRTSLSGVNAEFLDTGTSSTTYTLNGHEEKNFRIMINPNTEGQKTLEVTTENTELSTRNVDRFPVFVRQPVEVSEEVPGITAVQLAVIVLLATTVYWFQF